MTGHDRELLAVAHARLAARHPGARAFWWLDLDAVRARAEALREAFASLNPRMAYALKANGLPALVRVMRESGLHVDAGSLGELELKGVATKQVAFALESQIDQLAERLGMDPLDLRERNRLRKGDRLLSGQVLERDPAYGATIAAIASPYIADIPRCSASPKAFGSFIRSNPATSGRPAQRAARCASMLA